MWLTGRPSRPQSSNSAGVPPVHHAVPQARLSSLSRSSRSTSVSSKPSTVEIATSRTASRMRPWRRSKRASTGISRRSKRLIERKSTSLKIEHRASPRRSPRLKAQMQDLEAMEQRLADAPDGQVSLTDADARSMATSGRGVSETRERTPLIPRHQAPGRLHGHRRAREP